MKIDFASKDLVIDNIRLTYYRAGKGAPLLYLPGGGLGAMAHRRILELLALHYDVITPDLPGFGNSSAPQEAWSLESYAKIINRLGSLLQLKEFLLVGVSLGGGIALALARDNPSIKKMVVVDSMGIQCPKSELTFRYKFFLQKSVYELAFNRNYWWQMLAVKEFFVNRWQKRKDWRVINQTLRKCLFEELPGLDKINIPTLILWGKKDELFPPQDAAKLQAKIIGSKVVIVSGNHSWAVNRPQECCKFICDFFDNK